MLAHAAELRAEHRKARGWNKRLDALSDAAFARFGARCLWNMRPSRSIFGARVIADALRENGNMEAWRLAAETREELAGASQ